MPIVIGLITKHSQFAEIHKCYSQSFYNEKLFKKNFFMPTTFFNLSPSRNKTLVGKTLPLERFKSDIEFRYQVKVSEIQLRKTFGKFMIQIGLFKKFLSYS